MSDRLLSNENGVRYVRLSESLDHYWSEPNIDRTEVAFTPQQVVLFHFNSNQENGSAVRLSLTPNEMTNLIVEYQAYLEDWEKQKTVDDGLGELDENPF